MKIKILVPKDAGEWPERYEGKIVEVEVDDIIFPDGTGWNLDRLVNQPTLVPDGVPINTGSIKDLVGQGMKSLNITL